MSLIAAFQGFFDTVESGAGRARAAMADLSTEAAQSQRDLQEFRKAAQELNSAGGVRIAVEVSDNTGSPAGGNVAYVQTNQLRDAIDMARRIRA